MSAYWDSSALLNAVVSETVADRIEPGGQDAPGLLVHIGLLAKPSAHRSFRTDCRG
jgi:hypothetical protein